MAWDISKAAEYDDITHTLNYKAVSKRIIDFVSTSEFQLVETLATQAEVLELKSDPAGTPEGVVVESQLEAGLGKTTCKRGGSERSGRS